VIDTELQLIEILVLLLLNENNKSREPAEGSLNDPAVGRKLTFTRGRTRFGDWFTSLPPMYDGSHIAFLLYTLAHIGVIAAAVHRDVLFALCRDRSTIEIPNSSSDRLPDSSPWL
jgi:hypothetical protein